MAQRTLFRAVPAIPRPVKERLHIFQNTPFFWEGPFFGRVRVSAGNQKNQTPRGRKSKIWQKTRQKNLRTLSKNAIFCGNFFFSSWKLNTPHFSYTYGDQVFLGLGLPQPGWSTLPTFAIDSGPSSDRQCLHIDLVSWAAHWPALPAAPSGAIGNGTSRFYPTIARFYPTTSGVSGLGPRLPQLRPETNRLRAWRLTTF